MGKKGDLLRALKEQNTTYTFTKAQLMEHDKQVKRDILLKAKEDLEAEARRQADAYVQHEWSEREKLFVENHPMDNVMTMMSLLLAVSSRVLIERFHWKPIPKDGVYDRRNRTMRFADYIVDELDKITRDVDADIRRYCEETYDLYGVKYTFIDT